MTALSSTPNYRICDILYDIYEDNIFQNKICFSITAPSFIKGTYKFGHCIRNIDASLNPYHISTLKK